MKPNILQIEEIEQKYRVKAFFACIDGSRAWGLESTHSDKDLALIISSFAGMVHFSFRKIVYNRLVN